MTISQFQNTILGWYKDNRRSLPWRDTRDPYKILVSEIMLQQTQVSRVLIKYPEFIKIFSTIESLAKAPQRKLLKAWSGLGYWRRAIFLKQACSAILKSCRGKFPQDPKILEQLPGIGHYTARAIACFAFDNSEAFIDTNIRKIYLHFFFKKKTRVFDREILKIAKKAIDAFRLRPSFRRDFGETKEWHYALFDYGALVLKDRKINRQSKHYAKQSKFKGSFRSFRTSIMRFLLEQKNQRATTGKIQRMLKKNRSPYLAEKLLASLKKDGLVKKRGEIYSL